MDRGIQAKVPALPRSTETLYLLMSHGLSQAPRAYWLAALGQTGPLLGQAPSQKSLQGVGERRGWECVFLAEEFLAECEMGYRKPSNFDG